MPRESKGSRFALAGDERCVYITKDVRGRFMLDLKLNRTRLSKSLKAVSAGASKDIIAQALGLDVTLIPDALEQHVAITNGGSGMC